MPKNTTATFLLECPELRAQVTSLQLKENLNHSVGTPRTHLLREQEGKGGWERWKEEWESQEPGGGNRGNKDTHGAGAVGDL